MANRYFFDMQALSRAVKVLSFECSCQGSSAPTGVSGKGISGITRVGAGEYKVSLEDAYYDLLFHGLEIKIAEATTPAHGGLSLFMELPTADADPWNTASDPHVIIKSINASNTLTDIPADHILSGLLVFNDTSVAN